MMMGRWAWDRIFGPIVPICSWLVPAALRPGAGWVESDPR